MATHWKQHCRPWEALHPVSPGPWESWERASDLDIALSRVYQRQTTPRPRVTISLLGECPLSEGGWCHPGQSAPFLVIRRWHLGSWPGVPARWRPARLCHDYFIRLLNLAVDVFTQQNT